jgi:hypothetical protein
VAYAQMGPLNAGAKTVLVSLLHLRRNTSDRSARALLANMRAVLMRIASFVGEITAVDSRNIKKASAISVG